MNIGKLEEMGEGLLLVAILVLILLPLLVLFKLYELATRTG